MAKKIPTTVFSRGTQLMGLASKLAFKEISSRVKSEQGKIQTRIQMAQDVVKTLSHMKGASMKLGQLISMDMGEYLPPEILTILEQLHNKVTFLPYSKIEAILKSQLKEKFAHLSSISEQPLAAASIGQVHRATLDGEDVIIKVQYPGVAESIPSDLKLLKFLVSHISFFQGKEADMKPFFEEVEEVLTKEADYYYELAMHELYREKFKGSDFIIPKVYANYSTKTIITQEYIEGISIKDWLETKPARELKDKFADQLMLLYMEEIFTHGLVQTDPNPGNFLVTPDQKIALLDFGAVKSYDKKWIEGYRSVLIAGFHRDEKTLMKESIRLGFIDEREDDEVKALYLQMREVLAEPFRQDENFDFADQAFLKKSRDLTWALSLKSKYSPPPRDLLFLHRKLVGIFVLIKKLEARFKLKDYWYYVEPKKS